MKYVTAMVGALVLLSACKEARTPLPVSMTFFVSERPDDVGLCGSVTDARDMQPGVDDSKWRWAKTDDVSGLLFCQQEESGLVSAWREVTKNGEATHTLQFAKSNILFKPI